MTDLYLDIETFSSVDIKTCGAYKYLESIDFEILLLAYAFNDQPVQIVDLAQGEEIPAEVLDALTNPFFRKHAHNAAFERQAFKNFGLDIPVNQWYCTAIKAAYCGLPLSLDMVSKVLHLDDKAKLESGKALIRYFTMPCKPTKTNGGRVRNLPKHDLEKWEEFKEYCIQDVVAEREIDLRLKDETLPIFERELYVLDQEINDKGISIDPDIASNAVSMDSVNSARISQEVKNITGVDNPNSPAQLKEWIGNAIKKEIKSLAKTEIPILLEAAEQEGNKSVGEVLRLRQKLAKSSTKKYVSMLNCTCEDGRAHGLFQFYGANRTGRWAGRLIQVQNLPRNELPNLDLARSFLKKGDLDSLDLLYDDIGDTLSQLIRTAFVAKPGYTFAVADFSAIEARVIAWLAGEKWRLDVFETHGKIYEASGAMMFKVPIEQVTKGSELRQKAKIAELALGYQGAIGALRTMGGEQMGLTDNEMNEIVQKWRKANPKIVQLWKDLEGCAKQTIKTRKPVTSKHRGLVFHSDGKLLTIKLPSGRKLYYCNPQLRKKRVTRDNGEAWETESIIYMGMEQTKKQWIKLDTYGGKLAENITQAIARDLLAYSMIELNKKECNIVMHVHDEAVIECQEVIAKKELKLMCDIMSTPVPWAKGLPLAADGYLTKYYKKD